ncbi:hypothetical protein J4573_20220 [Actinomadura barringtoniae]|uniref:Subtilisin inhibitor domain-containing protein n=1 Tax=Actinomadura barringtoniae TaxID=1427535 RepID=A0A939T5F0_9ACTN|nr:SSI family serine proteinase inhibitor [Actinomadura barringtoniae]MBO2449439.1 hypothetical protein [Actinomadura barringtoniae]
MSKVLTCAAAAAIACLTVASATAAATAAGTPRGDLQLWASRGESFSENTATVMLQCSPDSGDHPKARDACAAITKAGGEFEAMNGSGICTREYAPITVAALGTWDGRQVSFSKSYANRCEMRNATGAVFAFGPGA